MSIFRKSLQLGRSSGARWRKNAQLLRGDPFAVVAAVSLVFILVVSTVASPFLHSYAIEIDLQLRNLSPFSGEHGPLFILGADSLGRSVLARIVVGGTTTLLISVAAMLTAILIGGVFGLVMGTRGGWIDTIGMRFIDMLLSFPTLLLAVLLTYLFQPNYLILVVVLAVTRVPVYTRVSRAEALDLSARDFVLGARALGASNSRIMVRHVAPSILPTLLTLGAVDLSYLILLESSLSYLGQGVQPPGISWGLLVAQGQTYLLTAWWQSLFPGLAITFATISLSLMSAWLRMVLDPRQRWRIELRRLAPQMRWKATRK